MHIEIYEFKDQQWGYRIKADNGEILSHSEGYYSKSNAVRAVKKFLDDIIQEDAVDDNIEFIEYNGE